MQPVSNINISSIEELMSPAQMRKKLPISETAAESVVSGRQQICDILEGRDKRLIVITGPCSIHDEEAAYDYAKRLKKLAEEVKDNICIVMRVYFEKPRTILGWKGLINEPELNGEINIAEGIQKGRRILHNICEMGLPCATEFLDPIVPQYTADLVSWAAIGARTTESQTHREMASGLSMPVGFKNSTDGSFEIALNAVASSSSPHGFLGVSPEGKIGVVSTKGNPYGHLVLRGGHDGPNYDRKSIEAVYEYMEKRQLNTPIIIDCSHANSSKDHNRQVNVMQDIISQLKAHPSSIHGVMIESNINEGNQPILDDLSAMKYGVSVTDKCLDWERTENLIREANQALSE